MNYVLAPLKGGQAVHKEIAIITMSERSRLWRADSNEARGCDSSPHERDELSDLSVRVSIAKKLAHARLEVRGNFVEIANGF